MPQARMRAVIVDDEPLARDGIRIHLEKEPDVEVVGEFGHVQAALEFLREEEVDLLFLDIEMPGASGFDLVERMDAGSPPAIVFVTAYAHHAVDAFRIRAVDYLLKPIDDQRFQQALRHVREHLERMREGELARRVRSVFHEVERSPDLPAEPPRGLGVDHIGVKASGRIRFVPIQEIDWVEADGDYVRLHVGRESHLVRSTMADLQAQLPPRRFVRIHRSTIVQVDRIREMQPLFHGEYAVLLRDGTRLKLSRGYRAAVEALLGPI